MPPSDLSNACYEAALQLVQRIDDNLVTGRQHYRDRDGQLLQHFDQVLIAIIEGNLELPVGTQTPQRGETLC